LFLSNNFLVNPIPNFSIYTYTGAALRQLLKNYVALLSVEVGQPCLGR
jgi:hypothetical protein